MKKLTIVLAFIMFVLSRTSVLADTQVCTQNYGGGVTCGAATPEHKPVSTGIGENLALIGGLFVLTSGALLFFSRKIALKAEEKI